MKKRLFCGLLAFSLAFGLTACRSSAPAEDSAATDYAESVIAQFTEIAAIPRPYGHEEKIGAYLMDWAKERDIPAEMDSVGNVFMEVPATGGMEDLPTVGLQVHMDMVSAIADGLDLDPLTTPVTVVTDDNTIASDGRTSLGADDGIGLSTALCTADGMINHGPLRIIITVGEEMGMDGALGMDPQRIADLSYLINLDNEESNTVCISSAGGTIMRFDQTYQENSCADMSGIRLTISGLNGGHSGLEIGKNGGNAIKIFADIISGLDTSSCSVCLSSLQGGSAENAIPQKLEAVFAVDTDCADAVIEQISSDLESIQADLKTTDPDMSYSVSQVTAPETVISPENSSCVIAFLHDSFNGVNTLSADIEGLVESSSNIGLLSLKDGAYSSTAYVRSSDGDLQKQLVQDQTLVADTYGIHTEQTVVGSSWKYDPDNQLLAVVKTVYRELFGKEIKELAVHAGLECGTFAEYNPDMDIVSIGTDISNPHTVKESVQISSIDKHCKLLEGILNSLS